MANYKKYKKAVKGITETAMIGGAGAIALGGIGGVAAGHGQAGIAGATRMMPAMGSLVGVGAVMETVKGMDRPYKRKRRRR